jgi:hypothetical protein
MTLRRLPSLSPCIVSVPCFITPLNVQNTTRIAHKIVLAVLQSQHTAVLDTSVLGERSVHIVWFHEDADVN